METKFFDSSNCESHSKGGFPSRSRLNFSFSTQKLTTAETKPVRRGINHRGNLGRSFFVKFRQVTQTLIRPVWFQHISDKKRKEKKNFVQTQKTEICLPKSENKHKMEKLCHFSHNQHEATTTKKTVNTEEKPREQINKTNKGLPEGGKAFARSLP